MSNETFPFQIKGKGWFLAMSGDQIKCFSSMDLPAPAIPDLITGMESSDLKDAFPGQIPTEQLYRILQDSKN